MFPLKKRTPFFVLVIQITQEKRILKIKNSSEVPIASSTFSGSNREQAGQQLPAVTLRGTASVHHTNLSNLIQKEGKGNTTILFPFLLFT